MVVATRPTRITPVWTTEVANAPQSPESWEYSNTTTAMAIAPTFPGRPKASNKALPAIICPAINPIEEIAVLKS